MIIKSKDEYVLKPKIDWHVWFAWHPVWTTRPNPKREQSTTEEELKKYPYYIDIIIFLSKCLRQYDGREWKYKLLSEALDD